MIGPYGGIDLLAGSPLLTVIEAKRTQLPSSEAEVLGQMRALMTK